MRWLLVLIATATPTGGTVSDLVRLQELESALKKESLARQDLELRVTDLEKRLKTLERR